jgi:D-glycero-D-manno-heptose 1,7-bisphosphate phosphatase
MARIPTHQAVFFELDGVVLESLELKPDGGLHYQPGALDALARIDTRRFHVFVATNREDVAFGRLRERDWKRIHDRFLADLKAEGIPLARLYQCPFHPKGRGKWKKDSVFRKPAPGMFKMAQQEFELNLSRSWMIGHTTIDVLAAHRAGMGTVMVRTGQGGNDKAFHVEAHFTEDDLRHAVMRIQSFEHALTV